MIGSLLLAGFVFFVLCAWFGNRDEIAAHDADLAWRNARPKSSPQLDAWWEDWKRRHPDSPLVTGKH